MKTVLKAISDWIKSLLTAAIMSNLSGLFDDVNSQVGDIARQVGTKPSNFEPRVFAMIEALSRNVVLPIAGIILTFIACYELIQMITEHNNMAQFEPALILKWIFKTAISVWMISNTFGIIMAVFDVTQQVVANSSGIISGNTSVNDIGLSMLESSMMSMDVGPLFGLFLQSFLIGITMRILSIVIFVIVYGRMIEIYMMVSLAPVPMATWGNHEQSHVGQNYLKSLFALGFQGFLILICVAIYAVLIQNIAISGDAIGSIWSIVGYTVLLCFSLFQDTKGGRPYLFKDGLPAGGSDGSGEAGIDYTVPAEALTDEEFSKIYAEAKKYVGTPYVWGGSSPDTGFDCSGYVCWVYNQNGYNVGRTTANGLWNKCQHISEAEAKPGDLVFFEGTYDTPGKSHVGIYLGNGMMVSAGDPIKYANIHSSYWQKYLAGFGRLSK